MSRRHKADWSQVEADRRKLLDAGYEIREFEPWHWHVRRPGSWVVVNVWPTARKYMQDGARGANRYKDVVKSVAGVFKSVTDATEQVLKAQADVDTLRYGGLEAIDKLL